MSQLKGHLVAIGLLLVDKNVFFGFSNTWNFKRRCLRQYSSCRAATKAIVTWNEVRYIGKEKDRLGF